MQPSRNFLSAASNPKTSNKKFARVSPSPRWRKGPAKPSRQTRGLGLRPSVPRVRRPRTVVGEGRGPRSEDWVLPPFPHASVGTIPGRSVGPPANKSLAGGWTRKKFVVWFWGLATHQSKPRAPSEATIFQALRAGGATFPARPPRGIRDGHSLGPVTPLGAANRSWTDPSRSNGPQGRSLPIASFGGPENRGGFYQAPS